jgi:hypothetical protein
MRKGMSGIGVFLAAALVLAGTPPDPPAAGTLDGKTFAGETVEKGKSKGGKDEFVFKGGKFRSTACDAYGFLEASYAAAANASSTTFSAETHSPKEGTMVWKGTVSGDTIDGTAVWTKKGQADITYTFHGTLKK